jgi:hypothetical protein
MDDSPDPFMMAPGSANARAHGCICDPQQAENGVYRVEQACPVHGLAELRAKLEGD